MIKYPKFRFFLAKYCLYIVVNKTQIKDAVSVMLFYVPIKIYISMPKIRTTIHVSPNFCVITATLETNQNVIWISR